MLIYSKAYSPIEVKEDEKRGSSLSEEPAPFLDPCVTS